MLSLITHLPLISWSPLSIALGPTSTSRKSYNPSRGRSTLRPLSGPPALYLSRKSTRLASSSGSRSRKLNPSTFSMALLSCRSVDRPSSVSLRSKRQHSYSPKPVDSEHRTITLRTRSDRTASSSAPLCRSTSLLSSSVPQAVSSAMKNLLPSFAPSNKHVSAIATSGDAWMSQR